MNNFLFHQSIDDGLGQKNDLEYDKRFRRIRNKIGFSLS